MDEPCSYSVKWERRRTLMPRYVERGMIRATQVDNIEGIISRNYAKRTAEVLECVHTVLAHFIEPPKKE